MAWHPIQNPCPLLGRGVGDDDGSVGRLVLLDKGVDAEARPTVDVVDLEPLGGNLHGGT